MDENRNESRDRVKVVFAALFRVTRWVLAFPIGVVVGALVYFPISSQFHEYFYHKDFLIQSVWGLFGCYFPRLMAVFVAVLVTLFVLPSKSRRTRVIVYVLALLFGFPVHWPDLQRPELAPYYYAECAGATIGVALSILTVSLFNRSKIQTS